MNQNVNLHLPFSSVVINNRWSLIIYDIECTSFYPSDLGLVQTSISIPWWLHNQLNWLLVSWNTGVVKGSIFKDEHELSNGGEKIPLQWLLEHQTNSTVFWDILGSFSKQNND